MKKNISETMKEAKQEKPIADAKGCGEIPVEEKAKAPSDSTCPGEELPDNEIEGVAGGISIIIPN